MRRACSGLGLFVFGCLFPAFVAAQTAAPALPPSPYVNDFNRNGKIELFAFGDSITRGVGDQPPNTDGVFEPFEPREEAGYPLRLENKLGIFVSNQGVPGEFLTTEGVSRFIRLVQQQAVDTIIISGGSNDSRIGASQGNYFHSVQKMINVAKIHGVQVVLLTPPPSCCGHSGFSPLVNGYIVEMRNLGITNEIPVADVARAFKNTCDIEECELLNLPEGLHPNSIGYDVFNEVILAALYEFDIFSPQGQQSFEQAFGLNVITRPDAVPSATPTPASS